jgi:hypothetical protein
MQSTDAQILNWLQEQRQVSDFIEWTASKGMTPVSRVTYYRATIWRDCMMSDSDLPKRQQYALRLARQYYEEKHTTAAAAV